MTTMTTTATIKMSTRKVEFNPNLHLVHQLQPVKTYTMEDLAIPLGTGVSPVAVSLPFELFTADAVQIMREEVLTPEVWKQHHFTTGISVSQLRGYAAKLAPFTYQAWTYPETLATISRIAGIALVPIMDYEIGHVNISNNITLSNIAEVGKRSQKKPTETTFGVPEIKRTKSLGVIAKDLLVQWHKDAYPFVCILSLSCPSNFSYPRGSSGSSASGGQTILQTAHNPPEYMTIPPPQFGQAVILQGRYITHAALPPADKNAERITMATSFRPLNSLLRQDCVLDTVKPNSDRKQLFTEYFAYRADLLKEKVDDIVARIREQRDCGDIVGKGEMARWSRDVLAHVQDMMEQVNDGEDLV